MSEYTENIRRAVKIGYNKLVDALDRMEKERDAARVERDYEHEMHLAYLAEVEDLKKNN